MEINGPYSIMAMQAGTQERTARSGGSASTLAGQGDRVSLSAEARRLMEHFRSMQFRSDEKDGSAGAGDSGDGSVRAGAQSLAKTAGGEGGSASDADQIENIKKRIKELQDKVKNIMDGDMSPEQKHSAASPYLEQIQELQQQLQQLMAAKTGKGKKA